MICALIDLGSFAPVVMIKTLQMVLSHFIHVNLIIAILGVALERCHLL